jgi:hypothetical protein
MRPPRHHVLAVDAFRPGQVRDGACDAQGPIAAAGAQAPAPVGVEQRAFGARRGVDVRAQQRGVHVGVARRTGAAQALALALARRDDTLALGRRRGRAGARELACGGPLQVQHEVEPVEQGPAQPARVPREVGVGAAAPRRRRVPARARVGRGHEHEARREDRRPLAAHHRHAPVLERLAQRLERRARELRQLVEEQDPVVGEARLPRRGHRPAADEPRRRHLVVWGAERALGD